MQPVTDALNQVVVTTTTLFLKTKNRHWYLSGPHFHDYYLLFDTQAEELLATIGILVELVCSASCAFSSPVQRCGGGRDRNARGFAVFATSPEEEYHEQNERVSL